MKIITIDAAAPYVELYELVPKYKLIKYLPIMKSVEVMTAPNQTYFQDIKTSGKYLNINANKIVITIKDVIKFTISEIGSNSLYRSPKKL